jgi:hypothetical protein
MPDLNHDDVLGRVISTAGSGRAAARKRSGLASPLGLSEQRDQIEQVNVLLDHVLHPRLIGLPLDFAGEGLIALYKIRKTARESLMCLAMSRSSCPVARLADSGTERPHAEMLCSSIYEIALSTDQSGFLRVGPDGAPLPKRQDSL